MELIKVAETGRPELPSVVHDRVVREGWIEAMIVVLEGIGCVGTVGFIYTIVILNRLQPQEKWLG